MEAQRWVNGMDGVVEHIELDPREPEDDGRGACRNLQQYPPVYYVARSDRPCRLLGLQLVRADRTLHVMLFLQLVLLALVRVVVPARSMVSRTPHAT